MVAAVGAAATVAAARWRILYLGNWTGRNAVYSAPASGEGPIVRMTNDTRAEFGNLRLPSPDGHHVLIDGDEDGKLPYGMPPPVYVAADDGSAEHLLWSPTAHDSAIVTAKWSPSSSRIAFLARTTAGQPLALHVAAADGTSDRIVRTLADAGRPLSLRWSGDGRHVRVINAVMRPVVAQSTGITGTWPARAPNGRLLAFDSDDGITVLDLSTHRRRLLTHDHGSWLTWSPDSRTIAYDDCCSTSDDLSKIEYWLSAGDIRAVSLSGHVTVVARTGDPDVGVVRGPFFWVRSDSTPYRAPPAEPPGIVADGDVGPVAADGDTVAFLTRCGRLHLWTAPTTTVTDGPDAVACNNVTRLPGLALAGDRLAYVVQSGAIDQFWDVWTDILGQPPQRLIGGQDECCTSYPTIAAEGHTIVYAGRIEQYPLYLWTVREPGGPPLLTFRQPERVGVALAVDGDHVLVARDGAVDVVLVENGGTIFHRDFAPSADYQPPVAAQLTGQLVAVLEGNDLHVYDLDTGSLLHTWTLPAGAKLLDAARGLLAYTVDRKVTVLELATGTITAVAPGTLAAFTAGGLAVANGARLSLVAAPG